MDQIKKIICCPNCRGKLEFYESSAICPNCNQEYLLSAGKLFFPVSLPGMSNETYEAKRQTSVELYKKSRLISRFAKPKMTHLLDKSPFNFINNLSRDDIILNLGSGVGQHDYLINRAMINLDIVDYSGTQIVADAHRLPFCDQSVDCVFVYHVLEHVGNPWLVAAEISRVLKPGGYVCVSAPFIYVRHSFPDYYRYTQEGLGQLFPGFKKVKAGVLCGPGSTLNIFLATYFSLFIPWVVPSLIVNVFLEYLFLPLKFLDCLATKKERFSIAASANYFIGQK